MKLQQLAVFLLASIFSISALADYSCTGYVAKIAMHPINGLLQVDAGYGVHYLCKIGAEENGVTAESCAALYSSFLAAQASGRQVTLAYNENGGTAQNCSELGNWTTPDPFPYHVSLAD